MEMQVTTISWDAVRVVLNGRLDMAGSAKIDVPFNVAAGANRNIIVDMSAVTFVASIGIRTLVIGAKTVQRRGGWIAPPKLVGIDIDFDVHCRVSTILAQRIGRAGRNWSCSERPRGFPRPCGMRELEPCCRRGVIGAAAVRVVMGRARPSVRVRSRDGGPRRRGRGATHNRGQ